VYFTRERHRSGRAYFGPYSNAKRVRATLEVLAKVFMFRSCTGPSRAGAAAAVLDYYISAASTVRGLRLARGLRRASRGDRLPVGSLLGDERDLDARMRAAAAEQEFEQRRSSATG